MARTIYDIITVDSVKSTTVAGVDLTFDDGSDFPDEMFEGAISQSIAMIEADLGIVLDDFKVKGERHDVDLIDRHSHYLMSVDQRPLKSINALQIKIGNSNAVADLPVSFATIASHIQGQFNLIPDSTLAASLHFSSGVPFLVGDVFSPYSKFPLYFSIDYTAGHTFDEGSAVIPQGSDSVEVSLNSTFNGRYYPDITVTDAQGGAGVRVISTSPDSMTVQARTAPSTGDLTFNWSVNDVDPMVIRAVKLLSAMLPLNIAGDLLLGAGIASQSISIDGLSQSVASTASATSAGYGARLINFNNELKTVMKTLRAKYRKMNFYAR
jgi:hypothetical protein